ncbi:unnamed protein product [Commensalibacter papalotli (ex Botero et al. 2024)]|uniref:Uncharacterized protein n=1 Tax=Commensalibacter papalotli (ex Botero et al. 2024) TaxID=2972766 RepID=A0ABM9HHR1_9PROT|nr:unnamed protein product [Commensalibacter papalotli (ex Botero et al. 2024)]CAI3929694.1 unnamed protein product [Commensalibacter papalotli (ex Botero et al. 2024)]
MEGYEGIADLTKELKDNKNQAVIENKNYYLFSYKGNTFIYFNP